MNLSYMATPSLSSIFSYIYIYIYIYIYVQGVPGGNVPDFGRMFLRLTLRSPN